MSRPYGQLEVTVKTENVLRHVQKSDKTGTFGLTECGGGRSVRRERPLEPSGPGGFSLSGPTV